MVSLRSTEKPVRNTLEPTFLRSRVSRDVKNLCMALSNCSSSKVKDRVFVFSYVESDNINALRANNGRTSSELRKTLSSASMALCSIL